MKIIDLSVSLIDGLPVDKPAAQTKINYSGHSDESSITRFLNVYPGLKRDQLIDGHGSAVELVSLSSHTGTHLDAPYHFSPVMNGNEQAWTIDELPLEWCIGDGVVVDFSDKPDGYKCTRQDFEEYFEKVGYTLKPGDIVCLRSGAMREWGKAEYLDAGCGVGREATLWLISQGVRTMGTDAWSWDVPQSYAHKEFLETGDPSVCWEAHKVGMEHAYVHYEKLNNLELLPPYGFKFIGFPIKLHKASAGWTRPVAILDD